MPRALVDLERGGLLLDRIAIAISGVHTEKLPFAVLGSQAEIAGLLSAARDARVDLSDHAIKSGATGIVIMVSGNGEERRPLCRLYVRDDLIQHVEDVRGELLDRAGIIDVAEMDDDVGFE